jgi:prepilin-type N-terminal cleavage/methylation domain-containing protein
MNKKYQQGVTLLEVVIAIAILGIIGLAIFTGLSGSTRSVILSDQRTTAESLARAQVEWIKKETFADNCTYSVATGIPAGFSVYPNPVVAENVTGKPGLQKVSFTVRYGTKNVLTVEAYKGNR